MKLRTLFSLTVIGLALQAAPLQARQGPMLTPEQVARAYGQIIRGV